MVMVGFPMITRVKYCSGTVSSNTWASVLQATECNLAASWGLWNVISFSIQNLCCGKPPQGLGLCFSSMGYTERVLRQPTFMISNSLIEECWSQEPSRRPTFRQIIKRLEDIDNHLTYKRQWKVHNGNTRIFLINLIRYKGKCIYGFCTRVLKLLSKAACILCFCLFIFSYIISLIISWVGKQQLVIVYLELDPTYIATIKFPDFFFWHY